MSRNRSLQHAISPLPHGVRRSAHRAYTRPILALAIVALGIAASLGAADLAPRPLSEAERQAVEYAAAFLDHGAPALAEALAAKSPLQALDPDARLDEIEAHTGPPTGATWELRTIVPSLAPRAAVFTIGYPSGIDETLTMRLVEEGGAWKIQNLEILAEPSSYALPEPPKRAGQSNKQRRTGAPLTMMILPAVIVIAALFVMSRSRRLAIAMMLAGLAGHLAATLIQLRATTPAAPVESPSAKTRSEGLRNLVTLRRALATADRDTFARLMESTPGAATHPAARLWKASLDLRDARRDEVKATLESFPKPGHIPLVDVLRARLAFLEASEVETAFAWERAIDLGPGQDGLWLEAADSMWILGFESRAREYVDRLASIGARDSDVYYALSGLQDEAEGERAEQAFRWAWKLEPRERHDLLRSPRLWTVLQRPGVQALLDLGAVDEPLVTREDSRSRPIAVPFGTVAFTSGRYLEIRIAEQTLIVPGGSAIAPADATELNARERRVRAEAEALAILERTKQLAASPGALAQPLLRRRIELVADTLYRRNQWGELVELTDALGVNNENVPTELFFMRAVALRHLARQSDAASLLNGLASSAKLRRQADAQTLLVLGEMFVTVDLYDNARQSFERAAAKQSLPYLDDRIRQILLDKRLASGANQQRTEHFNIRYFDEVPRARAERIGEILEAEFRRLQKWIPPRGEVESTTVHILSWEEFRRIYTGSDHILGFFDGKLRLPIGGAPLVPEVIAVLSHELAHAMIAQSTNNQAPHWFQEGLAQYVEAATYRTNAYAPVHENTILSLPLVEAVLNGYPDLDMTQLSYDESYAVIRYVDSRYGRAGIRALLDQFHDGASTEEAIEAVSKTDPAQFENDLRAWATEKAPVVWGASDEIRYADEDTPSPGKAPRRVLRPTPRANDPRERFERR